jgi:hypothetical protein
VAISSNRSQSFSTPRSPKSAPAQPSPGPRMDAAFVLARFSGEQGRVSPGAARFPGEPSSLGEGASLPRIPEA